MSVEFIEGGSISRSTRQGGTTLASQDPFALLAETLEDFAREEGKKKENEERRGTTTKSPTTPSTLAASIDDYDIGSFDAARLSSDASRDVTGFAGGSKGRYLLVINVGSFNVVLKHQSASSAAANRMISYSGLDITLTPDDSAQLWYDSVDLRWRILGH